MPEPMNACTRLLSVRRTESAFATGLRIEECYEFTGDGILKPEGEALH